MKPVEAFERMRAGFGMIGSDHRMTHVNGSLAGMLGYGPRSLLGEHILEIVGPHNVENVREQLAAQTEGSSLPFYLDQVPGRGCQVSVLVQPIPILDAAGYLLGSVGVVEPLGPEKLRREQAVSLARNARRLAGLSRAIYPLQGRTGLGPRALTARETEIVDMLLSGKVPKEVAGALDISVHTVRNHVKSIYRKLGVHSQVELFAKMHRR